jgi:hypothetical protein
VPRRRPRLRIPDVRVGYPTGTWTARGFRAAKALFVPAPKRDIVPSVACTRPPAGGSHGNSHPTARIHIHTGWRSSCVAARGARAAGRADAAHRRADGLCRERPGRTGPRRRVPGGTPEARVGGGPQHPYRLSLGGTRRRGVDTAIRKGTRRAAARPHSFEQHTHHGGFAGTNAHHSGSLPIRSAAASSRAFRDRAAT